MACRTPGPPRVNGSGKRERETGKRKGKTPPPDKSNLNAIEDTEVMSNRETEKQRDRETDETQETEDVPPLAACVKTLIEAVQLSLKGGLNKDCLFTFARALKAFEITTDHRLTPDELQNAFSLWWSTAQ